MIDEAAIRTRYWALSAALDERSRRRLLGAEALAAGLGGQAAVARATGASPATIRRGLRELDEPSGAALGRGRVRRRGGGRNLAAELGRQGHRVSYRIVGGLLHDLGYSLQASRKTLEGTSHPDRDARFRHIPAAVQFQLSLGEPVISVDTRKKGLVGPFRNGGRELRPKGDPERVLMHDFIIDDGDHGRVSPYGV